MYADEAYTTPYDFDALVTDPVTVHAKWYREYRCSNCGTTLDSGRNPFVLPDDVFVSLVYVF